MTITAVVAACLSASAGTCAFEVWSLGDPGGEAARFFEHVEHRRSGAAFQMLCSDVREEGSVEETREGFKRMGIYGARYEPLGWHRAKEDSCAAGRLEAQGEPTQYVRVRFGRDEGELCVQRIDLSDVQEHCE